MKKVFQDLSSGATLIEDVPVPGCPEGHVLVRTHRTLISAGTERMLVDFGRASWIDKARQQPDKVRMVLNKARTDGIGPTVEAVRAKLSTPLPMGYSNVGTVVEVGAGVTGLEVGDRVLSNGSHAEFVAVPRNLCVRVPDSVSDEDAVFGVVGAIALHGIRLIAPTLGERHVVIGLGLIGLIAVQILRASGCEVLGIDPDPAKRALAEQLGATVTGTGGGADPVAAAERWSRGIGVDGVLVTASAHGDSIMHEAATMCRKRGRIVLVGVVDLNLNRADFYDKELSFQVSCSYGPGRYDPDYEEAGNDYPLPYVRWTEQRNFEAVLELMAQGKLSVDAFVSSRVPVASAGDAYKALAEDRAQIGIVLEYPEAENAATPTSEDRVRVLAPAVAATAGTPAVSVLGAGNYASRVLIPAFGATDARLRMLGSASGASGTIVGKKAGFEMTTSDSDALFADAETDAVVIATRHDSHADLVARALAADKHVFVEKPLCLTLPELDQIMAGAGESERVLMVGFNRRFAPLVTEAREMLLGVGEPMSMIATINAGAIPPDHWTQDLAVGGGRIVGEACHFIDLFRFVADSEIVAIDVAPMSNPAKPSLPRDTVTILLRFASGSIGTIHYLANGNAALPKEHYRFFCAGRVLELDNFRRLRGWGWSGFRTRRAMSQDKGQGLCVRAFVDAIAGRGPAPISRDEIAEVSRYSIQAQEAVA